MIKRTFVAVAASISLAAATPALAEAHTDGGNQSADAAMEQVMGMFGGLFEAEELTPEQEVRVPAVTAIVSTMMPDGFYAEMMSDMMDSMIGPMMGTLSGETGAMLVIGSRLAIPEGVAESLSADQKIELATLLDPGFTERGAVMQSIMGDMMAQAAMMIEPLFREGLSRAYAVRFDEAQLADIATFFETPTGQLYATENMKLMADPQVMSASMQALPSMMGQFGSIEQRMKDAMAELPAENAYADLSAAERARLSELTGIAAGDLESAISSPKGMGDGSFE